MNASTLNETIVVRVNDDAIEQINEANELSNTVKTLTISNNQEYANSAEFLKRIKSSSKTIEDSRKEITKPLDEAKKMVIDFYRPHLNLIKDAECVLKNAMLAFQTEQERIRREAEAKAEAKARAEEERKRKALEERAKKEAEKGNEAKAEILREKADDVYVPVVVKAAMVEDVKGISTKKVWKAKVVDFKAIPQDVYINDEKVQSAIQTILNKIASATKGAMPISGVEFIQESSISAGRA